MNRRELLAGGGAAALSFILPRDVKATDEISIDISECAGEPLREPDRACFKGGKLYVNGAFIGTADITMRVYFCECP